MNHHITRIAVVTLACIASGCATSPVLDSLAPATPGDLRTGLGLEDIPYIRDDTFIANPAALLGQVVEIRKVGGACPSSLAVSEGAATFSNEPLSAFKVDDKSLISTPVKRDSQIVTQQAAATVSFLNYLSSSLDAKSVYSIILFDQSGGRVDDKDATWKTSIQTWVDGHHNIMNDSAICYLWVVKGYIQKNVVRRKFVQAGGSAKGGAYGVNVDGSYHTSTDDYSVDVRFGLSPGIIKRPGEALEGLSVGEVLHTAPTLEEMKLLTTSNVINHKQK